jgi:hypothetical protein|tara:strand:+ start:327 stop:941 length:615 start_codon:yes stop_codon:yes gene_type:complete
MAYNPPSWSALSSEACSLEVIKDGAVVDTIDLSTRAYHIIGRDAATTQITMPHPSVSRQHAVIQQRASGEVYFFDLGSTHGSTINKKPVPKREYVILSVGAFVRLGQASLTQVSHKSHTSLTSLAHGLRVPHFPHTCHSPHSPSRLKRQTCFERQAFFEIPRTGRKRCVHTLQASHAILPICRTAFPLHLTKICLLRRVLAPSA